MDSTSALADQDLVQRATAGDAVAVELLLRRHQPWIFNLALYMLQVRADAEDATQELPGLGPRAQRNLRPGDCEPVVPF